MQLVLRNADSKIRATFTGPDGEATAPTSPTVTITRDSDGEVIADAESATLVSAGVVSYTIPAADIPDVDLLHVSWSGTGASAPDDEVEVVGGFLCSLEEIDDDAQTARRLREQAEQWLEDACGVAFRPRYKREVLSAMPPVLDLLLSRPLVRSITSITQDDVAVDLDDVTVGETVYRDAGWYGSVEVVYEHGYTTPPEPIRRAVVKLAQFASTGGDNRISRFREDDQEVWLAVPGVSGETGIPEVDSAIDQYRFYAVG